jgi:hypothetical protein
MMRTHHVLHRERRQRSVCNGKQSKFDTRRTRVQMRWHILEKEMRARLKQKTEPGFLIRMKVVKSK